MIVPDKQTEKFLNEPASRKNIAFLCRLGVLPAVDFVRASALFRSVDFWKKTVKLLLSAFGDASLIFGLIVWVLPRADLLSRQQTVYELTAAFAVCEFFSGTRMRIAGSLIVGALIFSIDAAFGGDMTAHGALFLWTGLTFLRETADAEFYLSPVLLNVAFAVWNNEARFEYEALFFAGWAASNILLAAAAVFRLKRRPS